MSGSQTSALPRRPFPPETRRSEPPITDPRLTVPPVAEPTRPDTSVAAGGICASTDPGDQHTCLMTAIERNDATITATYERLVRAMRDAAGVTENDTDPPSVDDLRNAERRWLVAREAACSQVGSGSLYARARAQCFAEQSAARNRELAAMLAAIPRPR